MTNFQRIFTIVKSVILIILALLTMFSPSVGYYVLLMILNITLLIYGIRLLIYYFSLARFKVGGLWTLYKSIIIIDLSLLLMSIQWAPQKLVMIVLILLLAFEGVVFIMKAMKSKTLDSEKWKSQLFLGIILFIIAIICIVTIKSTQFATILYSLAIIVSAVSDIISVAKRSEIVYIG